MRTVADRRDRGSSARRDHPPIELGALADPVGRADPVALLEEQNRTREPDLVPVRHGRMMVSAFTFYRGSAAIMAADLARTPSSGVTVQLCGDAHLSNFGVFASPERQLVFDLNDFDETLPGPFEWDVKRLVASVVVAARDNGFGAKTTRSAARAAVESYGRAMRGFAEMPTLAVWYSMMSEAAINDLLSGPGEVPGRAVDRNALPDNLSSKELSRKELARQQRRVERDLAKARTRDSRQALAKLAERVDGELRIVHQPPLVVPIRALAERGRLDPAEVGSVVQAQFDSYRESLPPERRQLLDRFEIVDVAHKVVGVGSVGTSAWVVLFRGRDDDDPLLLQMKQATTSVLEQGCPPSTFATDGERVVQGQRLLQAVSDIFLGWSSRTGGRDFYWRQLRDWKGSFAIETMRPKGLIRYAQVCGWVLARGHARSGDPVTIAEYIGDDDDFATAMTAFADAYADLTEQDHQGMLAAIRSGRLAATPDV